MQNNENDRFLLNIGDKAIESSFEYHGINIDEEVDFSKHINKIAQQVNYLYRISKN